MGEEDTGLLFEAVIGTKFEKRMSHVIPSVVFKSRYCYFHLTD